MMQKEDWTFSRVAKRKRRDRAVQVGILAAALGSFGWAVVSALRALIPLAARALGFGGA